MFSFQEGGLSDPAGRRDRPPALRRAEPGPGQTGRSVRCAPSPSLLSDLSGGLSRDLSQSYSSASVVRPAPLRLLLLTERQDASGYLGLWTNLVF